MNMSHTNNKFRSRLSDESIAQRIFKSREKIIMAFVRATTVYGTAILPMRTDYVEVVRIQCSTRTQKSLEQDSS